MFFFRPSSFVNELQETKLNFPYLIVVSSYSRPLCQFLLEIEHDHKLDAGA